MEQLVAFVLTAALSALLTWLLLRFGGRAGWMDRPGRLKFHPAPVPTMGGVALVCSFLAGLWAVELSSPEHYLRDLHYLIGFTLAGLAIMGLGVWDDLVGCSAWQKFSVQGFAALILYGFGFGIREVTNPLDDAMSLDFLGFPITILWIVGVTNAINLIDGVDGLAAGVVLISSLTLTVIAFQHQERLVLLAAFLLAASLTGFIGFNLPPARIFLGDTGSLFLGLTISAVSLLENQRKGTVTVTLLLPIVLMAIPITDTLLAISRRLIHGRHPFQGDTEHLHHRLLGLGLGPWRVLLIFYSFSIGLSIAAYFLSVFPKQYVMLLIFALAACLGLALRALQVVERERKGAPGVLPRSGGK